ncbi:MAG TPA: Gfo/Idh/MocA family oxidoreductase [Tepidisphaeraceae bacterium]|nr:Gfo/Idh/MocA family oxidoreductase [Tepidisphaeraceae bacterium]
MNDRDLSRRRFLLSGAAAAAVTAGGKLSLAAGAPAASRPATTRAAATTTAARGPRPLPATTRTKYSQIRVACIGVGGRGWDNLNEMVKAGANVVALCDIDAQRLDRAAAGLPGAKKYADFRQLFDRQGNDIDAVVVSTPDHTHAPAAMRAIRSGKHVYCEKPLTYDIHEARVLTQAAAKHRVKTQMGNQGAALEASRRQVEYVRSGIAGAIREVHVYTNRPVWPQGLKRPEKSADAPKHINFDAWLGPAPQRPYHVNDAGESVYLPFKWRGYWDFGTGALGDMACHLMNTAYWALNLTNPASVEAFSYGATDVQGPNWSIIKYEFPQLGPRPPVTVFWYEGHLLPPTTVMKGKPFPGLEGNGTIFVGEKATIAAGYTKDPFLADEQQQKDVKPPEKFMPRSIGHHAEWLESILGGPDGSSSFDHSGPLTEMVLLGNLAVRTGRRVEWDVARMKVTNDRDAQQYVKREYRKGWEL